MTLSTHTHTHTQYKLSYLTLDKDSLGLAWYLKVGYGLGLVEDLVFMNLVPIREDRE